MERILTVLIPAVCALVCVVYRKAFLQSIATRNETASFRYDHVGEFGGHCNVVCGIVVCDRFGTW
jgi:hypothetical protein